MSFFHLAIGHNTQPAGAKFQETQAFQTSQIHSIWNLENRYLPKKPETETVYPSYTRNDYQLIQLMMQTNCHTWLD